MKKEDVPQHRGLFGQRRAVCYALDSDGEYVLTPTAGWDPANLANRQAWEAIAEELTEILHRVQAGELSPLAYHMARNQMTAGMLAKYVRIFRWRVRRHLRPEIFSRLDAATLQRYAEVLRISVEELQRVPDELDLEMPEIDEIEDSEA
ncbi:hypothetical protein [Trichloromonas sp.]|uniref:hypothetical protein n=1 Tax=Trichloromonas sp. TaxID=3069249 RepID=UPI003D81A1A7